MPELTNSDDVTRCFSALLRYADREGDHLLAALIADAQACFKNKKRSQNQPAS